MSDLKEFYEEHIRRGDESIPAFEKATPETLKVVEKSITFAGWKLKKIVRSKVLYLASL